MKIKGFEWDGTNINHIRRHGVKPEEVEEVFCGKYFVKKSHTEKYYTLGQTETGRYLTVVFELKQGNIIRVITARNMDTKERRIYRRERGG